MTDGLIKNTLVFRFPEKAAGPTLVEIARFVKAFDADKANMESSYKIPDERCICIKFKNEAAMKEALLQNTEFHQFRYSNGNSVEVQMAVSGGCLRYVRVFDLPPEVSDLELSLVLGKYGSVKRIVREKFPAELELDLYTGIRGVYMDITKDIPPTLYFRNRRGRIYYEGLKHRCFLCKQEGHMKATCPQKKPAQSSAGEKSENEKSASSSYAGAVKGLNTSDQSTVSQEDSDTLKMVKLVSSRSDAGKVSTESLVKKVVDAVVIEGSATDENLASSSGLSAEKSVEEEMQVDPSKSNKRPLTTSSKSTSETDEEDFHGFTKVDRSGRSRSRRQKKSENNALEIIAVDSQKASKERTCTNKVRSRSSTQVRGKKHDVSKCQNTGST